MKKLKLSVETGQVQLQVQFYNLAELEREFNVGV